MIPENFSAQHRELARHYIPASEEDLQAMLQVLGQDSLESLYSHIPSEILFEVAPELPEELSRLATIERMESLASANHNLPSFIGDGLANFSVSPLVGEVAAIRALATAYTPYQPERSQGTLTAHWIYQCLMAQILGFEAVNASLYDRATAIYEAILTARRLKRNSSIAIVPEALYPGDLEVLETLASDTSTRIIKTPLDPLTGCIDHRALQEAIEQAGEALTAVVIPQVNNLGLLEDVDALTLITKKAGAQAIAVVDPALLATGGLKPPSTWGIQKQSDLASARAQNNVKPNAIHSKDDLLQNSPGMGADIAVGEAQHLAIGPNFGGPGLGFFAIRYNEDTKVAIRQTPGRFIGKALDHQGRDCRVAVLSTREQHIRKEKATSNICSNQAFLATLVGASLLEKGESGFSTSSRKARQAALETADTVSKLAGLRLAFPESNFYNEVTLETDQPAALIVEQARQAGIHLGIDVSERIAGKRQLVKLSFSDRTNDLATLLAFLKNNFTNKLASQTAKASSSTDASPTAHSLPPGYLRQGKLDLPQFERAEILAYYHELAKLNVSPDEGCYPLGSCTMKYNPLLNEWAANLPGFTNIHPQAPEADTQGCLELLYEIQEWFKTITGLPGVTTQPLAGAQGELVGLKLFQAYHRDKGEAHRNVLLIPRSAHGTNFATAAVAGFDQRDSIVYLNADSSGTIDMDDFQDKLTQYRERLCGVMITNPNTSGIFENDFRAIARQVHEAGGLVYMDGANMNAIAGWVDLGALGVDAVHNNLHKTWTIPHGGGGPGDAIVAVSQRLIPFLPGRQIVKNGERFHAIKPEKSIGSFHRHWGNFAHKVRAYTYLLRLGRQGVRRMSAVAVLSARYLHKRLRHCYSCLPAGADAQPRMHEFILTISEATFQHIEAAGIPRAQAIPSIGKLFLDFGFHAPTVAWPEPFGLMIEPTESYTKAELDRFAEAVEAIADILNTRPDLLSSAPHFTPVDRIDEVAANRSAIVSERLTRLPTVHTERVPLNELNSLPVSDIKRRLLGHVNLEAMAS